MLEARSIQPPLSQAVGYVVVVVIGLIIAFGMWPGTGVGHRCTSLTTCSDDGLDTNPKTGRWGGQQED